MSFRLNRRLQRMNAVHDEISSPRSPSENYLFNPASTKHLTNMRKVRKTEELFHFSFSSPKEEKENLAINYNSLSTGKTQSTKGLKKVKHQALHFEPDSPKVKEKNSTVTCELSTQELPQLEPDSTHKRKIVKAKRLLKSHNVDIVDEVQIKTDSEIKQELKKKRRTWQKQNNFDNDSIMVQTETGEEKVKEAGQTEVDTKTNHAISPVVAFIGASNSVRQSLNKEPTQSNDKDNKVKHRRSSQKDLSSQESEVESSKRRTYELSPVVIINKKNKSLRESLTEEVKQTIIEVNNDPQGICTNNCVDEKPRNLSIVELSDEEDEPIPKKHSNSFEVIVTSLKNPISPSTSNTDESNSLVMIQSNPEKLFDFKSSEEELNPSTSGAVEPAKRRTYELENSVNDVSLLKTKSEEDTLRINSQPDSESKKGKFAKVTLRKKLDKNDWVYGRISKISPPWKSEDHINSIRMSTPTKVVPSSTTSTPMSTRKVHSLLKNVLTKDQPSTVKKPVVSNVKMPNFALIHQKAYEKMESLSEYKERKEKRAKILLSGSKPVNYNSPKKQIKKQLRFAANTSDKEKSVGFIPLPTTPLPKRVLTESVDTPETPDTKTPQCNSENLFAKNCQRKILTPKNIETKPDVFNFGNNGFNRFGFNKPVLKKEELKAMVSTKSRVAKNTIQSRRVVIKGVRSNRRFDLLMEMRKGK